VQTQKWFGTLTIKIERGVVRRIMREEIELPPA
jgi:hypothetical protein